MKFHKLLGIIILTTLTVPTQAAVYGTLKQDLSFKVEGNQIVKASGTGVSIIGEDEHNYVIQIDQDTSDLVGKNFIKLQGTITTANKNAAIMNAANSHSEVLGRVNMGDMVMVLEKEGSFYKVKVNGMVGFIYSTSLDESKLTEVEENKGKEIVSYAKQFLGGRYVYGGNDLNTGVDCSGFAQQVMKHFNVSISRSSRAQYANNGYKVSESEIKEGDLVFYGYGCVNHVAIYIGNGQVIHANDESTGIIISELHYGKPVIGIKRVVE